MEIPFVGGAYQGRSTNLNAQVCQNYYPVLDKEGGKKIIALYGTPGLVLFGTSGVFSEVRGVHLLGDVLYAVIGNTVYQVSSTGTCTALESKLKTNSGKVWMAENVSQLMITDGSCGYIVTGETVTKITDADFPTPASLTYQDQYFIVAKKGTHEFYISALIDGLTWAATDYSLADGAPDDLLASYSYKRLLWQFGTKTTEIWYNSGNADFPFERYPGGFFRTGIKNGDTLAELPGGLYWLSNRGQVVRSVGLDAQPVSTPQIDYQIAQCIQTDARAFGYTQEGHNFYILTTDDKTFAFDETTGFWHTRASGNEDKRHRANCYCLFNGKRLVGDFENGKIYEYSLDAYDDDGEVMRAIRAAQAVHADRKQLFHYALEIEFEAGVGLTAGAGVDPKAMLQWSDDGGHTWGNEHWSDIGKKGKYADRCVWRRLGQSRDRIYRVIIADKVKRVIVGATLDAEVGTS